MGLFGITKRRNDGKLVKDGDPMSHVMTYVMRGRNESAIYYKLSVPMDNIQKYIVSKRKEGLRVTLFNVVVTALLRTISERPRANRFVAGRRLYQHNELKAHYVVKQSMTDDGIESVASVVYKPGQTIMDVQKEMSKITKSIKKGNMEDIDKVIRFVLHLPRWLKRFAFWVLLRMDFNGMLPKKLIETLPFYATVFVSHLGTIGGDAVFHHLYEFGTNSIFLTIGRAYGKPVANLEGGIEIKRFIDLAFTIDERICDGYYLVKTLRSFEAYLNQPKLLEEPGPELEEMKELLKMKDPDRRKLFKFVRGKSQKEKDINAEVKEKQI